MPSEWHKQAFISIMKGLGYSSTPSIAIVHEAVDTSLFVPSVDRCHPDQLLLRANRPFIFLSIFKWEHRKGWDVLLDAYWDAFNPHLGNHSHINTVELHIHSYVPSTELGSSNITYQIEEYARLKYRKSLHQLPVVKWINSIPIITSNSASSSSSSSVSATSNSGKAVEVDISGMETMIPVSSSSQVETNTNSLVKSKDIQRMLSRPDMKKLIETADAFVLPTRGEGWGLPIAEAMSLNIPVIVTNCSGILAYAHRNNSYLIKTLSEADDFGYAQPDPISLRDIFREVIRDYQSMHTVQECRASKVMNIATEGRETMKRFASNAIVNDITARLRYLASVRGWKM